MTSNKAYNISILCRLRRIAIDSEEAIELKTWTILKLLNAIKETREQRCAELCTRMEIEVDSKQAKTIRDWTVSKVMDTLDTPDDEVDISITRRVGCVHI